jgi:hypothetical protein
LVAFGALVALVALVAKFTDWLPILLDVINVPPDCGLVAVAALPEQDAAVVAFVAVVAVAELPVHEPDEPVVFWFSVGNVQLARFPDVGVPSTGVTNVGLVESTVFPEPVEVVTPVPPLTTGKVPVR